MDFIEDFYSKGSFERLEGYDREKAQHKAFKTVLPLIMEKELTKRQSICLRYKYLQGKNQQEIATLLHLSQPTVSRHLATAKKIVNSSLQYCYAAVVTALDAYDSGM